MVASLVAASPRFSAPPLPIAGLHLLALCTFAVAEPLFDLLGKNPEFFVAHDSTRADIILFALAVALGIPLLLVAVEAAFIAAGEWMRAVVHLVLVGSLVALIALEVTRRATDSTAAAIALAVAVGVGSATAYARARPVRSFATALSAAVPVFAALFLLDSPTSHLVLMRASGVQPATDVHANAPVVMIVFDEFPEMSLLDTTDHVDARRFPAFGDLARHATWFRSASASSDQTLYAVPATLSGSYPHGGDLPVYTDYPHNVFTLLGGDYRLEVHESVTHLCPPSLCKRSGSGRLRTRVLASDAGVVYLHLLLPKHLADRLPTISEGWANFRGADVGRPGGRRMTPDLARRRVIATAFTTDRRAVFEAFIAAISRRDPPRTLYFAHMLLPHRPWSYLPSGRQYGNAFVFGSATGVWPLHDDWLIEQAYRRYLLQVGFVDHMLARLFARLRRTGLYDRSLIVITADHGMAFRAGQPLRGVRDSNYADIAPVPLFVKAPHQEHGEIVDRPVQTVDVLPTIADVLGVRLPWPVDGRSGFSNSRASVELVKGGGRTLTHDAGELTARTHALVRRWTAVFGAGTPLTSLYGVGPAQGLVGRATARLATTTSRVTATLDADAAEDLDSVDLSSSFLPTNVTGTLHGGRPGLILALAVDGRIAATTESFKRQGGATQFEAVLPETALRNGRNDVQLFVVNGRKLERVPLR